MKIAISSCGIFLDSPIDPRFGRCDYFVIVNMGDMSFEVFDNENLNLCQGAGIQSARFVISKDAKVVISGNIGPNAISALSEGDVEVLIRHTGTIREAVEDYRKGKLKSITTASVREHYGMVGEALKNCGRHEGVADEREMGQGIGDANSYASSNQPAFGSLPKEDKLKRLKEQRH
jgi:predicted Fe-Mo cluster-binding NifX family protein